MELYGFLFAGIRQVVKTGDATPTFLKSEQLSFAVGNPYALSATSGSITGCLTSLYSISKFKLTQQSIVNCMLNTRGARGSVRGTPLVFPYYE